jgi:hypothetical protein
MQLHPIARRRLVIDWGAGPAGLRTEGHGLAQQLAVAPAGPAADNEAILIAQSSLSTGSFCWPNTHFPVFNSAARLAAVVEYGGTGIDDTFIKPRRNWPASQLALVISGMVSGRHLRASTSAGG